MIRSITKGWRAILKIGYDPSLPVLERSRTMLVNGLTVATSITVFFFFIAYIIAGYKYYYIVLVLFPPAAFLLYLHHKKQYRAAKVLYVVGSIVIVSLWAFIGRRNGNEYILIAVATTSSVIFNRKAVAYLVNFICLGIFIALKVYDYTQPFIPDPAINYDVLPMAILLCTVGVLSFQMAFFHDLVHHYDNKLSVKYEELNAAMEHQQRTDEELMTSNEELTASNDQLYALTNQLEVIVKQKSAELQSYIDAINVNICSVIADARGVIVKVNEPMLKVSGYAQVELLGQNFGMFNADESSGFLKTALSGGTWRGEVKNKRKDGSFFWIDMVILPIKGKTDTIDYFLTLSLPITERKLHEEARENTIQILESIAFSTSHDIRGPLHRIQGLANLVQKDFVTRDEFKQVADQILICSQELNKATTELVGFVNTHQTIIQQDVEA
jgi:PAS domain S-box-containing protein